MEAREHVRGGGTAADGRGETTPPVGPLTPPPQAVPLRPESPPAGAAPAYLERYYSALANVRVALLWVTPAVAADWLATRNKKNRPLSPHTSRKIRAKVADGLWHVNGEAVVFGADGRLLNGQHRLRAIADGETAVPILVVYGVDPGAFTTYDQGRKRSGTDVLALLDQENCSALSGALRFAVRGSETNGDFSKGLRASIPNEQLSYWLDLFPGLVDSVAWAVERRKTRLAPVGMLAYLHWLFSQASPDHAADFFEKVVDGVGVMRPSWHKCLRNRLEGDLAGRRQDADQIHITALFVKAFNFVLTGHPCLMHPPKKGSSAEREPMLVWRAEGGERFPTLVSPPYVPFVAGGDGQPAAIRRATAAPAYELNGEEDQR